MTRTVQNAALAIAFVAAAQTALADVTPQEVWQNWQDGAMAQGQTVTAKSTSMDGDTLTVTDMTISFDGTDGKGSVTFEQMQFQDNGDGTVAVILPDSFPMTLSMPAAAGVAGAKPTDLTMMVTMPDAAITASGVPDSLSYETDMPTVEVAVDTTEGEGDSATKVDLSVKLTGVTGTYLIEAAEVGTNLTQDFAAKTLDVSAKTTGSDPQSNVTVALSLTDFGGKAEITGMPADGMADLKTAMQSGMTMDASATYGIGSVDISGQDAGKPIKLTGSLGGGGFNLAMSGSTFHSDASNKSITLNMAATDQSTQTDFVFTGTLADFNSQVDIDGMVWDDIQDFPAALKAGLKMTIGLGIGASSFDFASGAGDNLTKLKASVGGSNTAFALDALQLHYAAGSKAVLLSITAPDIPVPYLTIELGELAFDLAMPVAKSATPAAFTFLTRIVDLKVPDALWAMIDPAGSLPHTPATLIIDTKGTATLTKDLITDVTNLEAGTTELPGQLNSLDLTQLLARVAGAEVTAAGAFTFDNTDTTTIPDMPYPTGKIDIKAVGVNALIDKLVAMGLLPEDQAMEGRMMLSMFANTSADKDEMTSTLEFKDKHFFANGQQLQ